MAAKTLGELDQEIYYSIFKLKNFLMQNSTLFADGFAGFLAANSASSLTARAFASAFFAAASAFCEAWSKRESQDPICLFITFWRLLLMQSKTTTYMRQNSFSNA